MGIPAAFRWLSNKYPKIISPVIEDQPMKMEDGTVIPVDATRPNPNGEEFDNLYLDMNGIVHPCTHPDDRPAPSNEEEMMLEVFRYTDRVVNMVRPRKLLMIAVDGVAPRAKMNQQRARRFRAAQEAQEKEADKMELLKLLKQQNGGVLPPQTEEGAVKKAFDSNSITPGTPFMDILSSSLRYWCAYKLNNDPAWAKLKIIISDASVPGEGEHKIMEFVRSQRSSPDHDPNTRHVIYGLDADLIMLGLATHEPYFRVLREDVFFQEGKARMCKLCGQKGHDAQNCRGDAKEKDGEHDEKDKAHPLKPFIWLHVNVLREYLAEELHVPGLPFRFDLERAIDDWVFLCFFVGNDFLPHLPALEIREHGIDTLTTIWRDNLPYMGGYMTKDGHVDLDRAQLILAGLAKQEDSIFKRRKEQDDRREAGFKRRKLQQEAANARNAARSGQSQFQDGLPSGMPTHDMIVNRVPSNDNKSAASALRQQIQDMMNKSAATAESSSGPELQPSPSSALGKRKASIMEADNASTSGISNPGTPTTSADEGPTDTVRLWEDGYADRYYEQKFKVDRNDVEFRHKVGRAYVEGLAWVLRYYFQGCPSWEWYYPYHYAPFAQDFVDLGKMEIKFEKGRISRPFEQLMSVLPAASRHAIPEIFHDLMLNEDSEIIDFYPEDFDIDLNGKKMIWQGVILLPFIDMPRLLSAVQKKYPLLSEAEATRNSVGHDILIFSDKHPTLYDEVAQRFFSKKQTGSVLELDPKLSDGLSGKVIKIEDYIPHMTLRYPFDSHAMEDVEDDRSITVNYEFPTSSHIHKSMILRGARLPPPVLDEADKLQLKEKSSRNGRSYGGVPLQGRYNRDGGRRNMINYGPDRGRDEYQDRSRDRGGYDGGRNHNYNSNRGYQGPPQGNSFLPPPPGMPGFGAGLPPPPPPGYYNNSYGNNSSYGSNNGHGNYGYGNHRGGYDNSGGWNNRYGPTRDPYGGPPPDHYGGAPPPDHYGGAPPPAAGYHSGRDYRSDNRRGGGGSGGYRGGRDNRSYR